MRPTAAWALTLLLLTFPTATHAATSDLPPHANAGSDQTVHEGDTVVIDAGNTYDNDPADSLSALKFNWRTTPPLCSSTPTCGPDPDTFCDSVPPGVAAGSHLACRTTQP